MAKVGAQRAAELTGKSKSTIQRAMKNGKLSFEMNTTGHRVIDVSELERVYGLAETASASTAQIDPLKEAEQLLETERLKLQIKMLQDKLDTAESQIEDLKSQRNEWQKQAQQVLITSQHSQEQAKSFQQELENHRKADAQRRHMIAKKKAAMKAKVADQQAQAENENSAASNGFLGIFGKKSKTA